MTIRSKVVLSQGLSGETLDGVRNYLRQFLDQRYSIEHFDGKVSIYLHDPDDIRLLRENFPSLITNVQRLY